MLTIFSKPQCPFCDQAKALLKSYRVAYTEVNVAEDADSKDFLVAEGHRSVPQFYVGTTLFVSGGFTGLKNLRKEEIIQKLGELNAS